MRVWELREAMAGMDPMGTVDGVAHTPRECCPGHVHDITELIPDRIEAVRTGDSLTLHLRELSA